MSKTKILNIDIGTPMQLAFETVRYRLKSDFVGMMHQSLLIVSMPPSKSVPNATTLYSKGTETIIRFVYQGIAYGFSTTILRALYKPAKLLFLDYPKDIEIYQLRNYERVLCLLPVGLKLTKNETVLGHVTDISKEGCQFSAENDVFYNKHELPAKENNYSISLRLPGFENTISISCQVMNINQTKEQVKIGLKYVSMSDDSRERLYDFLESVGVT
jgi:c-di-GMP-binding flagellar brake protein YcgR